MHVGKVPNGYGKDDPRVVEKGSKDDVVLVPRQLLRNGDSVSISGDLRERGADVERLVDKLRETPERDLSDVKRRLDSGELDTAEVLREAARRILSE